jgi:hypothetical protein
MEAPPDEDIVTQILQSISEDIRNGGGGIFGPGDDDEELLPEDLLGEFSGSIIPFRPDLGGPDIGAEDETGLIQTPGDATSGQFTGSMPAAWSGPIPDLVGAVVPGQGGVPSGLQPNAARGAAAARRILGFEGTIGGIGQRNNASDHPHGNAIDIMTHDDVGSGWSYAQWFLENRDQFGVTYIIFDGAIASPRGDWQWRPYRHPAGRTDPTAMHKDHVHISFRGGAPVMDSATASYTGPTQLPQGAQHWEQAVNRAAQEAGIDAGLLAALIQAESGFNPNARSHAGAIGLAQLMPGTAAMLGVDPWDPLQNLAGGATYLAAQLATFGSVELALAAYNAGPGAVESYGGVPPFAETQLYILTVLERYEYLSR